jgi:hypothetical protein
MSKPLVFLGNYNEFAKAYDKGQYPHQRFGQAFVNTLLPQDFADPILFYEEDRRKAERRIIDIYLWLPG